MRKISKGKLTNILIVAINVVFVFGLALAEWQYIRSAKAATVENNKESFVDTNVSLSSMTNNYLVGEGHLCRSWSNYLNSNVKTVDEALDFVRESITDTDVMGHIVYAQGDRFVGYSTKARSTDPTDFSVDYTSIRSQVFSSTVEGVKTSPSYVNPTNGSLSIAFYSEIKLIDPGDATKQIDAYLMRVVLLSNLRNRWTFPSGSFSHLEVTLMDHSGAYVIAGLSFMNQNFFEFYKSYNPVTLPVLNELKERVTTSSGLMTMLDSSKERCYIAYSQVTGVTDWTLLTYIPAVDIEQVATDWLLLSILGVGLALLFIVDLTFLLILNKNLAATAKLAEKANQAKTDFLSTMSHDIRTPMNAIIGLTTLAKKDPGNPIATQDALKKIELASNHLLTLINDILDLSKIESGRLTINAVTFSIVDTFENLVNISQPMVKAKNIDFAFRAHHFENEWLFADKLRLSQIFTNLVSNALKYTDEGGRVTVEIEEKPSLKENNIQLVFVVADTGMGMSPEFLERMYQPFSRATDSRVNSIQGTGLGLAITKQMVDLMGGTIDCRSEVGKGTTFTVTLDIPIGEKPNEEMVLPPIDVLVVDDDEILLQTAVDALSSLGAKTDVACNGKDALKKIEARTDNQYKIIIVDWKMPDMSGIDVAKKIKELHHGEIPIILVSAYDWSEIEKDAVDAGINGFIFKPLFRSKIYQKIIELLDTNRPTEAVVEDEMDLAGVNVLVVEDNEINWEIVSSLLEVHGIASEHAENGKQAVELFEDKLNMDRWDLVFMDIQMPVMNGLDATRAIRKLDDDYARNIPIIAMTADAFSEDVALCLEAGMNGHIAKPIDLTLVLAEIRKICAKKHK